MMDIGIKSKYLYFSLLENKPKTRVFGVHARSSDIQLGIIKWHGPWRQYCFFPAPDCLFSKGCLEDINLFIDLIRPIREKR